MITVCAIRSHELGGRFLIGSVLAAVEFVISADKGVALALAYAAVGDRLQVLRKDE